MASFTTADTGGAMDMNDDDLVDDIPVSSRGGALGGGEGGMEREHGDGFPSIYIDFVHANITRERIKSVFEQMKGWGVVARVDLAPKPYRADRPRVNTAVVHFAAWGPHAEAQAVRQRYLDPREVVRVEYDAPWYWKTKGGSHVRRSQTSIGAYGLSSSAPSSSPYSPAGSAPFNAHAASPAWAAQG